MTDRAAEARKEYKRKWARENRDKVKAYNDRYWEKKADAAAKQKAEAEQPKQ